MGILGFSNLKITKVPNYLILRDKFTLNIVEVIGEFNYVTHKCKQKETKNTQNMTVYTAWAC